MRNFVVNTPGVTFFQGEVLSFVVRKSYIEYVIKAGKGTYGVVNLFITGPKQVSLFCSWGHFFDCVNSHQDQGKLFKMLEKQCPLILDLFTCKSGFVYITIPAEGDIGGIIKDVNVDKALLSTALVGDPAVLQAVKDVFKFSCELYNEILKSCPFEGWKKELKKI